MSIIKNYNYILNFIQSASKETKLIVVTKNQEIEKINLLINSNHFHLRYVAISFLNILLNHLN